MSDERARSGRVGKQAKTPAVVNTVVTLVLLLALTSLVLHAAQSPPPAVAEFAPQVQQHIKEAPQNQGGEQAGPGNGPGGAGPATTTTTVPPSAPPKQVPSNLVKRCVGNPPRQIEDSQSPPCIAYWEGDNGGATSPGVTKDTIYVTVWTGQNPSGETVREFEAYRRFFNQRFQLYGRQLVFEYCKGGSGGSQPADAQADAASAYGGCASSHDPAADQYGAPTGHVPFAASGYNANYYTYDKEMGCTHHVVTTVAATLADAYMRNPPTCFPYIWQYSMANESIFSATGQWTCARLAGKLARFAGGTDGQAPPHQLNQLPRKFGLIVSDIGEGEGDPTSTRAVYGRILDELKVCGVTIAPEDLVVNPSYDPGSWTATRPVLGSRSRREASSTSTASSRSSPISG